LFAILIVVCISAQTLVVSVVACQSDSACPIVTRPFCPATSKTPYTYRSICSIIHIQLILLRDLLEISKTSYDISNFATSILTTSSHPAISGSSHNTPGVIRTALDN
jgi:hypothetical protein